VSGIILLSVCGGVVDKWMGERERVCEREREREVGERTRGIKRRVREGNTFVVL
jgi:hypothetical protein